jgi:hypothetical protein
MPHQWPANTVFRDVVLEVEDRTCPKCPSPRSIESRRVRHLYTCEGPVRLICQLCHCSNPNCPEHQTLVGPETELKIAMPYWVIDWGLLCWLGHRRLARHWSVPQIRHELADRFGVVLSDDAITQYARRYQQMVAARQCDPDEFHAAYQGVNGLVLSIDGLQPEKGHETLYVVREFGQKRVWFATALLSSTAAEVKRVLERAKEMVDALGIPVRCWVSDKQDALVRGIAQVFPGVPHRYCDNHFLRDLAKPMLEADSKAKVQMRKKVRGLRKIEQAVEAQLAAQTPAATRAPPCAAANPQAIGGEAGPTPPAAPVAVDSSAQVVRDLCVAVRGILNDNRGGPRHPPGERMAQALTEVRQAIVQNPEAQKGGPRRRT